jgi:hypothetical protein
VSGGLAAVDMQDLTDDVRRLEERHAVDYVSDVADPPVRGSRWLSASSVFRRVHGNLEMTHLGSAIWSQIWRRTGVIFWLTRPTRIIRSACRGVADARSMPKQARSCRGPLAWNSLTAQHARPEEAGGTEFLRV